MRNAPKSTEKAIKPRHQVEQLFQTLLRIREEEEDVRKELLELFQQIEFRFEVDGKSTSQGANLDTQEFEEPETLIRDFGRGFTVFQWQIIIFEERLITNFFEAEWSGIWPEMFFIHGMYLDGVYKRLKSRIEIFEKYLPTYEEKIPKEERDFITTLLTKANGHLKFLRVHFSTLDRYSPQLKGRLDLATIEEVTETENKRAGRPPKEKVNYKIQFAALQFYASEFDKKLDKLGHKDKNKIVRLITGASESVVNTQYFGKEGERVMPTDDPNRVNKTEWPKLE